ncbi:MAG: hypothetical protein DMG40_26490 [Acidobacteria bacterium]|nr:MAG: hypothetical protein DMG40_26490 [Acidobacteriota bacterium]
MPKPQPSKQLHALCHEHHIEMSLVEAFVESVRPQAHASAYACPQPDCGVHYAPQNGYFVLTNNGNAELDMTPRVSCPRDGQRMHLAEINPEKKAFRLWRCPQRDSTRTNEEDLLNEMA